MKQEHTIWTATQELDIDNLKTPTGTLNVLDMVSDDDSFLQMPCEIVNGVIHIASIAYPDADNTTRRDTMSNTLTTPTILSMDVKVEQIGTTYLATSKGYRDRYEGHIDASFAGHGETPQDALADLMNVIIRHNS